MAGPLNAFVPDSTAHLPGAEGGPLAGLTFAAKDIFDIKGHVTGCGNPHWLATHEPAETNAQVVQQLVDAGASMVGKTITDELTRGIFGENMHYGTPVNPNAPGRVPGGSSSGSASAVAGRLVDFALGSDTGGSVRVPSSFCGLFGLRPTHGRIPLDGMLLQAPSFDTIGWFARDAETFAHIGSVMLPPGPPGQRPRRLVVAEDAWELAEPGTRRALETAVDRIGALFTSSAMVRLSPTSLEEWSGHQQVLQSREAWESARDWIDQVNPTFSFEVSDRYAMARSVTDEQIVVAQAGRDAVISRMNEVFDGGDVVVCLPTTVSPAPLLGQRVSERHTLRLRNSALTSIAGNTGRPQISLPLAEVDGLPVGLSLLGDYGADEQLIELAREISRLAE
ncbi:MAG: amidase [Chloroflexota bacterium]|nr:amidase [Chloroflexota bacterium]MDE2959111.1 amidase [Chloroflexota bacterium]